MSAVDFSHLPDDARVWVFAASRPLTAGEAAPVLERVDRFLDNWLAHGHPVVGARDWRYDRFLLVAADERATGVSGCSIDTLFRALREVERETGMDFLDRARVWFRGEDGEVRSVTRAEFRALVREGEVGEDTVVFNNTVATTGELRTDWEVPMRDSWHAQAFPVEAGK
ncbi:MAG TPA: hypothetical protein VHG28_21975 [Longimicrobiaceae bacterium]|nr:hypothetical protein [Longimicrobiaceae bacterium]